MRNVKGNLMPKVAASNGVRPEIRALAVLQLGKTVTPQEINDHVGTGDYAAKYVSFLNTRYGFTITANKDGRKVVSYNVVAEPANAADLRAMQPKASKTKTVKAPKAKKLLVVVPSNAETAITGEGPKIVDIDAVKAKNLETMRKVAAKMKAKKAPKASKKKVREFDDVTETFGTSGEVGTSFSVERDWDSVEGLDLKNLL
jgi:hypothetical protein